MEEMIEMSSDLTPSGQKGSAPARPTWFRALLCIAGIVLVFLSFLVWGYPLIAGLTYVYIFGFALLILGAMRMGQGIVEDVQSAGTRVLLVIFGILLFAIGLYAIAIPPGGALTLIFFFAFALIIAGIDRLVLAWAGWPGPGFHPAIRVLVIIAGIIAVVFGFVALLYPGFGAALLFVIISIGILVLGVELIVSAITNRRLPGV
jgi:uncharacterized membrane protein HdeD (DUF308 family)